MSTFQVRPLALCGPASPQPSATAGSPRVEPFWRGERGTLPALRPRRTVSPFPGLEASEGVQRCGSPQAGQEFLHPIVIRSPSGPSVKSRINALESFLLKKKKMYIWQIPFWCAPQRPLAWPRSVCAQRRLAARAGRGRPTLGVPERVRPRRAEAEPQCQSSPPQQSQAGGAGEESEEAHWRQRRGDHSGMLPSPPPQPSAPALPATVHVHDGRAASLGVGLPSPGAGRRGQRQVP